jgi:hypothetical protein
LCIPSLILCLEDYPLPNDEDLQRALSFDKIRSLAEHLQAEENSQFIRLKNAWLAADHSIGIDSLTPAQQDQFCKAATSGATEEDIDELFSLWLDAGDSTPADVKAPSFWQKWKNRGKFAVDKIKDNIPKSLQLTKTEPVPSTDASFLLSLESSPVGLSPVVQHIRVEALKILQLWWTQYIAMLVQSVLLVHSKRLERQIQDREEEQEIDHRKRLVSKLNSQLETHFHWRVRYPCYDRTLTAA